MNNELFRKRAKSLAERLLADSSTHDERLEQLWLRVLARPMTAPNDKKQSPFLKKPGRSSRTNKMQSDTDSIAWQELCHSLMILQPFCFSTLIKVRQA